MALPFLKYSIFTVMALAMAGCSAEHYYDSTVPPAAYTSQQEAAMQAVSGDSGAQTDSELCRNSQQFCAIATP